MVDPDLEPFMRPHVQDHRSVKDIFGAMPRPTPLGWVGIAAASAFAVAVGAFGIREFRNTSGADAGVADKLTILGAHKKTDVELRHFGTHGFTNAYTGEQGKFTILRPEVSATGRRCYAVEMVGGGAGNNATVKDETGKVHKVSAMRTLCAASPSGS
jgi:hypothetical protein